MLRKQLPSGYRTAYWITAPEHEKGIGLLLSEDPVQSGTWMYFPASSQVVHVAIRGLSALASDFSCEDLRVGAPLTDYGFRALGPASLDGVSTLQVEMVPRTERLRSELGFSKSVGWVRDDIWLIVRADYYDENGKVFKTFRAGDVQQVQGIWTARRFTMENLRAQHSTEVRLAEVDYGVRLSEDLFAPDRLAHAAP
jgi:outer membrane lipoprotein-sorting protein